MSIRSAAPAPPRFTGMNASRAVFAGRRTRRSSSDPRADVTRTRSPSSTPMRSRSRRLHEQRRAIAAQTRERRRRGRDVLRRRTACGPPRAADAYASTGGDRRRRGVSRHPLVQLQRADSGTRSRAPRSRRRLRCLGSLRRRRCPRRGRLLGRRGMRWSQRAERDRLPRDAGAGRATPKRELVGGARERQHGAVARPAEQRRRRRPANAGATRAISSCTSPTVSRSKSVPKRAASSAAMRQPPSPCPRA